MVNFVIPTSGYAQQNCSEALIVDTYNDSSESSRDYRLSKFVTEGQWNELKKGGSGRAVIYGVPIGASYSEYQANSRFKEQQTGESLTEHQARNILWTGLSDNSLEAYTTCLHANSSGLFFYVKGATHTQLEVIVRYNGAADANPLPLSWSGGTPEVIAQLPLGIRTNESIPTIVNRPSTGDYLLAMRVVNGSFPAPPSIRITAWPPLPPPPPVPPCQKNNSSGQCEWCKGSLERNGVPTGGSVNFACPKTIPDQAYSISVTGEVQAANADRNVGSIMDVVALGPNDEAFGHSYLNTSGDTGNAFRSFSFDRPSINSQGSAVTGSLRLSCNNGGNHPCNLSRNSEWRICLVGSTCE